MLRLKKIAVTGGVASGKSSVCRFFKELGAFTVDADAIVHDLLDPASNLGKQVAKTLHIDTSHETPRQFRKQIADKVFKNDIELQKLEQILHPTVCKTIEQLYATALKDNKNTCFVVEIPLLFEIQHESFYDGIITVLADEALAKRRFREKGFLDEEYDLRMKRQLPPHQKATKSSWVIRNHGSLEDLKTQVINIYQTL